MTFYRWERNKPLLKKIYIFWISVFFVFFLFELKNYLIIYTYNTNNEFPLFTDIAIILKFLPLYFSIYWIVFHFVKDIFKIKIAYVVIYLMLFFIMSIFFIKYNNLILNFIISFIVAIFTMPIYYISFFLFIKSKFIKRK